LALSAASSISCSDFFATSSIRFSDLLFSFNSSILSAILSLLFFALSFRSSARSPVFSFAESTTLPIFSLNLPVIKTSLIYFLFQYFFTQLLLCQPQASFFRIPQSIKFYSSLIIYGFVLLST